MSNVQSKYFNISESLNNALVVMVAELLSQGTYVRNVKSKYFKIDVLLHKALVLRVALVLSRKKYV